MFPRQPDHVLAATEADATVDVLLEKKQATIEPLEAVSSTPSAPRLYIGDRKGGGVEYLHCTPVSSRRRRKVSLESQTVQCGRESHGTRTLE
jgi:ribosomal protein S7